MRPSFEELASAETAMGTLSLRRRSDPVRGGDVYEVKLGDEFLMSSSFTVAEIALARLGLAASAGEDLDVVVGGLGLGYTARAALEDPRVRSLLVVEALPEVIDWHERALLPEAADLVADPRTQLVHGNFFAMARGGDGFDPQRPGRRFDAVLLDVDHTPRHVLHPSHAPFYTAAGLRGLARWLTPDGVFALWSDAADDPFLAVLREVFDEAAAHEVRFRNPLIGDESTNTVFVARSARPPETPAR